MVLRFIPALLKPAVKATAAGVGFVLAGPAGGVVGSAVGGHFLGPLGENLLRTMAEHFTEKSTGKFLEESAEPILAALKKEEASDLAEAYRESVRLALEQISDKAGYEDWFENWNLALKSHIDFIRQEENPDKLAGPILPKTVDPSMISALTILDAQGRAIKEKDQSLDLSRWERRPFPTPLSGVLDRELPELIADNLYQLLCSTRYQAGLNRVILTFNTTLNEVLIAVKRLEETAVVLRSDVGKVLFFEERNAERLQDVIHKVQKQADLLELIESHLSSRKKQRISKSLRKSKAVSQRKRQGLSGALSPAGASIAKRGILESVLRFVGLEVYEGTMVPTLDDPAELSRRFTFVNTDDLSVICGELNASAFSKQIWKGKGKNFSENVMEKIERNSLHARKNPYCLLLIKPFPVGGFFPTKERQYVGFSHVIPLTEEGYKDYVAGRIQDNSFPSEFICGPEDRPSALLIFSIAIDGRRALRRAYQGLPITQKKLQRLKHRAAQELMQALTYHVHFLMSLYADPARSLEILAQTDGSRDVMGALQTAGFRPTSNISADCCPIWSVTAKLSPN